MLTFLNDLTSYLVNPPAPACQGHQGCVSVYFAFHQLAVMLFSYQAMLLSLWRGGLKSGPDPPHQINLSGSVCMTKTPSIFKSVSKALKKRENRLRNSLKTISVKSCFLQYLPCEHLDLEVPRAEMSIQKSIKG